MIKGNASPYQVMAPMTYATVAELFSQGTSLLATGEAAVFDLSAVTCADSSALAVILGWQRAAGKQGRLRLINLPESIISLAELYGIAEMLPVPRPA